MNVMELISNWRIDIWVKSRPIKLKISFRQVKTSWSNKTLTKSPLVFIEETSSDAAGQDNRDLCDEGTVNQTLQHDEIEQMKSEGASGQTIISQLISKSATFEKKTVYSQQKYLNKKKKK